MPTPYARLAEVAERLSQRSSRNEKLAILASFLASLEEDEVAPAVKLLLGGRLTRAPLEVGWATLKTLAVPQATLISSPLTITEVWEALQRVAALGGRGSRRRKRALLMALFSKASSTEARYLARCILGEMRTGVSEGLMVEAIARAFRANPERVRLAHALLGDISEVAQILSSQGRLPELKIRLFTPVKPMLAESAASIEEALHGSAALEYKYDGARVQIHRYRDKVKIFSRRLRELGIEGLRDAVAKLKAERLVVEGEVIALGENGKPLPFQDVIRALAMDREAMPELRLYLFDILHLDGRDLFNLTYKERWARLEEIAGEELLATRRIVGDADEAMEFYQEALREGHEGVVVKRLESPYEPGKRSRAWLKVKPFTTLDLAVIAAEWGHGRRRGWLSNLHLGALDEEEGRLVMVGKTFKGLSHEMLEEITRELLKHRIAEEGGVVRVTPTLVVEVAFDEVQRSPRYEAGLALRFARVKRLRRDKGVEEVDTLAKLREIYQAKLKRKGSYSC
ncbi:ATP-dependent DNA ligase [Candidatus Pyrohabitans sp.]